MRGINPAILGGYDPPPLLREWGGDLSGGGSMDATASIWTPPEEGWPDAFMSYPAGNPNDTYLENVHGDPDNWIEISYLSFENVHRPQKPIRLLNCSYIRITRIDTRGCTMGLAHIQNCNNIEMSWCRAENIAKEFEGQILGTDFSNDQDCNFWQCDNVSGMYAHDMKGRYGNTEDVFSFFNSNDNVAERLHWEGARYTNQPTSNGASSVMWTSESGTGCIMGDGGGSRNEYHYCTFLNAGQVHINIVGGADNVANNCIFYGQGNTSQPWNNGITTYPDTPPCTGTLVQNTRGVNYKSDGSENTYYWGCGVPDLTGSVLPDYSLDPNDLKVVL